jgi:arginine N-succinyltransferase
MGQPHPSGRAAMKMLENEGFVFDRYIDIFDGGPTVTAPTDQIRTVEESETYTISEIGEGGAHKALAASGWLSDFRACGACVRKLPKKTILIDAEAAELLEVGVGDRVLMVGRNGHH